MEHEKQVEVVKQALELETQIQVLEQFLPEERAETYAEPEPQPPVRQEAHYTEPPIRHGCKVNWLLMLGPAGITLALSTFSNSAFLVWMFALTLFVWVPVYYFALYRKQKAATIERIRNSAEYQQQCTAARMATNRQQQEFDEAYTKAKEEYDSVLLPRYQAARSAWETEHQAQIRKEEQELSQAKKELAALYGETRIVPAQYRRVDALQYIYDMISTSDYDVRQAIEYFDKSQQRALEEMRLQEQQQANALAMEQNDLLDRQNSIAEKARRDANIAAAVGAGLADIVSGAPIWAPFTLVIKACIALLFTAKKEKLLNKRNALALLGAWPITCAGYYIAEAIITGNWIVPAAGIPANTIQAAGSAVLFVLIALALDKMRFKSRLKLS